MAESFRSRGDRFRIMIGIDNATAGKTTILQKVCGQPRVLDRTGQKTDGDRVIPSNSRGEHDRVENEITYPGARGYILHDSRGFEAGGPGELNKVSRILRPTTGKSNTHILWRERQRTTGGQQDLATSLAVLFTQTIDHL